MASIPGPLTFTADNNSSFIVAVDGGRWFNVGYYQKTAAEIAAGVTPTNYTYAPGVIDRYGANSLPGTTDMGPAFAAAISSNEQVTLLSTTYLIGTPVTATKSVVISGTGYASVLLAGTTTLANGTYSNNIFTCTSAVDHVFFEDLTLDGACAGPSGDALKDDHEVALVKILNASRVVFDRVNMTRYCASFNGTPRAISQYFFQGITIQNATHVNFKNCLWTDNHYEMCSVWNGPTSDCQVIIDGCQEINTAVTPDSHTAFETSGGHTTITNCLFKNTGKTSNIAIQVAKSVRIAHCTFSGQATGATTSQIEIGQDTWPFNSSLMIENNYLTGANSAAISIGQGSSQVIRGNVIDSPAQYGIKLTNAIADSTFTTAYPLSEGWPAVAAAGSNSVVIENNVINAPQGEGGIGYGIYLHTANVNNGLYYKGVSIKGNQITGGNTIINGMVLDDLQDVVIEGNRIEHRKNALLFESLIQNALIDGNTFSNLKIGSSDPDIIWVGSFSSHDVRINRNYWNNLPAGPNACVYVFAGTVANLTLRDNINIGPRRTVDNPTHDVTLYDVQATRGYRTTGAAAPSFPINYAVGDRFPVTPTSGQPIEYVCTVAGTIGSALTSTCAATSGNTFFTPSVISQYSVGMIITITGAGSGGATLTCAVASIDTGNNKVYVDEVIVTTVAAGTATALKAPAFIKSANYT